MENRHNQQCCCSACGLPKIDHVHSNPKAKDSKGINPSILVGVYCSASFWWFLYMVWYCNTTWVWYQILCHSVYSVYFDIWSMPYELQPKFRLMESSIRAVSIFWKLSWGLENDNTLFEKHNIYLYTETWKNDNTLLKKWWLGAICQIVGISVIVSAEAISTFREWVATKQGHGSMWRKYERMSKMLCGCLIDLSFAWPYIYYCSSGLLLRPVGTIGVSRCLSMPHFCHQRWLETSKGYGWLLSLGIGYGMFHFQKLSLSL